MSTTSTQPLLQCAQTLQIGTTKGVTFTFDGTSVLDVDALKPDTNATEFKLRVGNTTALDVDVTGAQGNLTFDASTSTAKLGTKLIPFKPPGTANVWSGDYDPSMSVGTWLIEEYYPLTVRDGTTVGQTLDISAPIDVNMDQVIANAYSTVTVNKAAWNDNSVGYIRLLAYGNGVRLIWTGDAWQILSLFGSTLYYTLASSTAREITAASNVVSADDATWTFNDFREVTLGDATTERHLLVIQILDNNGGSPTDVEVKINVTNGSALASGGCSYITMDAVGLGVTLMWKHGSWYQYATNNGGGGGSITFNA